MPRASLRIVHLPPNEIEQVLELPEILWFGLQSDVHFNFAVRTTDAKSNRISYVVGIEYSKKVFLFTYLLVVNGNNYVSKHDSASRIAPRRAQVCYGCRATACHFKN